MIINRGDIASIVYLKDRPESILFIIEGGAYYYAEQGTVENELRVMGNWETAGNPHVPDSWFVTYDQGTEIPQELGDYLVANQDLVEKVLIVKRGYFPVPFAGLFPTTRDAFDAGVIAGVFECGEILSRPLSANQDNEETSSSSSDSKD